MTQLLENLSNKQLFATLIAWCSANASIIIGMLIFIVKQNISMKALNDTQKRALSQAREEFKELAQELVEGNYKAMESKLDELLDMVCKKFNLDKADMQKEYDKAKAELEEMKIDLDEVGA